MNGIPVARIFGIEIRIQLGWVLALALIGYVAVSGLGVLQPGLDPALGWALAGIVAIGFFLSSLVHDLAHALVARRRGLPVTEIAVSFFGGATPSDPPANGPRDDFTIAVAGPLASLVLGALLGFGAIAAGLGTGPVLGTAAATLGLVSALNLLLGSVNLLPAYPLDGGRMVRAIGWRRGGSMQAGSKAAAVSGRVIGFAAISVGVAIMALADLTNGAMIALSGWFLVLSSRSIIDRLKTESLIGGLHVQDAMEPGNVSIGPGLTVDTFAGQLLDDESAMTVVPVVSDDAVVGVLGVREVRRLQRTRWPTTRVEDVMTKPPRLTFLAVSDPLIAAVERLQRAGVDGLPVLDGGSLVGMLTRRSIGRLLHERGLLTREGRVVT